MRFYHLQRKTLEQALPQMLEKCLERGWRAVVMAGSPERVESLNQHLWTYKERGFLPHGSARDGEAALQPIWLTPEPENPNQAEVLFLTDGAEHGQVGDFRLVCELFDGRDAEAVEAARGRWKAYRAAGHEVTYWQQTPRGNWERKA